jgi:hypothetical protein
MPEVVVGYDGSANAEWALPVRSRRVGAAFGEGQEQRGTEDHYHDRA